MATVVTSNLDLARAQTLALLDGVSQADLERVHSPLLSPLVWDLGHIAAFEDLWLCHREGGLALLHPELMDVYDAFETPRAQRGELPYLRCADAFGYLQEVRARVHELAPERNVALIERHERQHCETMLQTLMLARLDGYTPPFAAPPQRPSVSVSGLELVPCDGATFPLGTSTTDFAYDNERPVHDVSVEPFLIGRTPVTNGDWQEFIARGGYEERHWWTEDGWAWRRRENVQRPLAWTDDEHEYLLGAGAVELDRERPVVHVSWFEASAFACSHELRLPSEREWELAASWDGERKRPWPWGTTEPTPQQANLIESGLFRTTPSLTLGAGAAPCGALAMIGDVWEWTSSTFAGYPGFVADPYPEYSEVFFDSAYRVLRGGSFAASAAVVTPTFRNWDYPQRRQIFSGVRVACNA